MDELAVGGLTENSEGLAADQSAGVEPQESGEPKGNDGKGEPTAVDPRFAGKSAEELISIINEQNRYIGRQGNALSEVGTLRQAVSELQNMVAMGLQQRERYQPQQAQMPPEPDFDYTNPAPYIQNIVARQLAISEQQRAVTEQHRILSEAQVNFVEGREAAFGQNPELFQGIERDVEQAVRMTFANGTITPAMLRSPKTWVLAAKVLRIERGEDDKIAVRRSMKAMDIEKPGKSTDATTDEDEIVLTDDDREDARRFGLSEKEAKENIRYALKARARR